MEEPRNPANAAHRFWVGKLGYDLQHGKKLKLSDVSSETVDDIYMRNFTPVLHQAVTSGAGYMINAIVKQFPRFATESVPPNLLLGTKKDYNLVDDITSNYGSAKGARPDTDYPNAETLLNAFKQLSRTSGIPANARDL